jgi:Tol biopolymer transport system component
VHAKASFGLNVVAPIAAGLALVVGLLALLVFVVRVPQRVFHWWTCNSASTGAPSWSPSGTRIVFAKKAGCDTELYIVNRNGTDLHRLAETRTADELPAWSPTGTVIAFVASNGIYTMNADGTGRRRISKDSSDFGVAWSPDGRKIAFTHGTLPGPGGDLQTSLYVMNADGSGVRQIIKHSIEPGTPAWSPNGRLLSVAGYDGIYVLHLDGLHLTRVFKEDFGFNPVTPSWSPDGRTISFVDDGGVELVDVGLRKLRRTIPITGGTFGDATSWTPAGEIVFSISNGRQRGIYVVQSGGRGMRKIVSL